MGETAYMCKNRYGTYYARFIIPIHLQSHFENKKEIRRSLQTDSRKLAVKRARIYRVQFENIVDQLMSKTDKTSERVKQTVDSLFAEKVTINELSASPPDESINNDSDKTQLITFIDLFGNPVTVDTGDDEQDAKLYNLIKPTLNDVELAQQERRAEEKHQAELKAIAIAPAKAATKPINLKKLSEYLVDYKKFQTTPNMKGGWSSPGTIKNTLNILNPFCSDVGNIPAASFGYAEAEKYIKLAFVMPPYFRNKGHAKKFIGITLEMLLDDVIDMSHLESRASSTICNDLKTVRAFLEWMRLQKRVKELQDAIDEFDKTTKRIDMESDRRGFTPEELKILFEQDNPSKENYVKGFAKTNRGIDKSLKRWLPILGLYTGATIAELCQLHLSDIKLHKAFDGSEHWIIDMNAEVEKCATDGDVRFKTTSRPRLIPVHKVLFDLGFTDHVQSLKDKGEVELFPTSRRTQDKHGAQSFGDESKWWGDYSSDAGITDKNVVFHSFRHNLTTCLENNKTDRDIIAAIVGHSKSTTAIKFYSKDGNRKGDIAPLVEAFNKIDYGLIHPKWKSDD